LEVFLTIDPAAIEAVLRIASAVSEVMVVFVAAVVDSL
jgi:hypothetical protein